MSDWIESMIMVLIFLGIVQLVGCNFEMGMQTGRDVHSWVEVNSK